MRLSKDIHWSLERVVVGCVSMFNVTRVQLLISFVAATQSLPSFAKCNMDDAARKLVERHLLESGGRSALLQLKSISRRGQIWTFNADDGFVVLSYSTDIIYPTKLREELKNESFTAVDRGTDGKLFWELNQGQYREVVDKDSIEYLRTTARIANRDLLWLEDDCATLKVTNTPPAWAPTNTCAISQTKDGKSTYLCFDGGSGLESAKGTDDEYRTFGDWTWVGKIRIPFRLTHYRSGKKVYEIKLIKAEVDNDIDPSSFQKPQK